MEFNSIISIQVPKEDEIHKNFLNYIIFIPVLFAMVLSFLYIDINSFWLDEVYSISFVNQSWSQLWEIISQREANMTIYYILLKIWVGAFGDSEFMVRSLSVIFAIAGVIMTYAVAVCLFNIRIGLTSSFILAVNAFFIYYAQEARGYTLLLLLVTCSMYLFIRAIEMQHYRYYIALGMTNALVLYSHFFGFFVLIAQVFSLVFLPPGTIRWRKIITSTILTGFLAAPLGVFILTRGSIPMGWIKKSSLRDIYYIFWSFTGGGGKLLFMSYFVPCFLSLVILGWILVRFKKSEILWRHALPFCWLFIPIFCLYILSLFKPFFVDRYMFFCLPALVILAGAGLLSFRSKALSYIATSLLIIISIYTVFVEYYPRKKGDWRSATNLIVQNAKAGDAIFFYSQPAIIPFKYYYRKMNAGTDILVSVYPYPLGTPIIDHLMNFVSNPSDSMLESLSDRYTRLWVVLAHDMIEGYGWDSRPIIQKIERKYINRKNIFFNGINVKLYETYSVDKINSRP